MSPQRGQATPEGQRSSHRYSRHLSSFGKRSIKDTRLISAVMAQKPKKKKRKLPKDILERPDHEVMEKIFGKRVMKEVDRIVQERSQDIDNRGD